MFAIADRYILRQVATPLAGAMAIGLLMLLAERMVRLLDTTLGKKNSFARGVRASGLSGAALSRHCHPGGSVPRSAVRFQQDVEQLRDSTPSWRRASGCTGWRGPVAMLALLLSVRFAVHLRLGAAPYALCLPFGGVRRAECRGLLPGRGRRVHAGGLAHLHPRHARPRTGMPSITSSCSTSGSQGHRKP